MILPPITDDLRAWARAVTTLLSRGLPRLAVRDADARASEDGLLLWDRGAALPVVSVGGAFRRMPMLAPVPATATDPGEAGMLAADASYLYVCTGPSTWKRTALSTF